MKHKLRRVTALILALSMAMSLLGSHVWATESVQSPETESEIITDEVMEDKVTEDEVEAEEFVSIEEDTAVSTDEEEPDNTIQSQSVVASGTCGTNLTWTLDSDGTLRITGTGKMSEYGRNNTPWMSQTSKIIHVVIENGVTYISDYAFEWCSSMTSITIPDGVTSIGAFAFEDCNSMTSITIPDSVTSIGVYAFIGCSNLTSITISDSVTSIAQGAFNGCSSLTSVTIPDSVTIIDSYAFDGCSSLTSVTIPDSVTIIGSYAFAGCGSLTSVTIPTGVTSINFGAFEGCSSLTSVTIPDSVTYIDNWAFDGCSSLTSITIPDSVTSIGSSTFNGCSSLTNITIPDSVTSIYLYAFNGCSSLKDVYYSGTKAQWNAIDIYSDNDSLASATIHYNKTAEVVEEEEEAAAEDRGPIFNTNNVDINSFRHSAPDFFHLISSGNDEISFTEAQLKQYYKEHMPGLSDFWYTMWLKHELKEKNIVKRKNDDSVYYLIADKQREPNGITYTISDSYRRLVSNQNKAIKKKIIKKMNDKWDGACHGVAVSMALASQGINLAESGITSDYYHAGAPKDNIKLRDTIHYYHLSQHTTEEKNLERTYKKPGWLGSLFSNDESLHSFLQALVNEGRKSRTENKPFIFSFHALGDCHTIVAYDLLELNDGSYEISLYDENNYYKDGKLRINLSTNNFSFTEGKRPGTPINNNNYKQIGYIGIDDLYNRLSTLSINDENSSYQTFSISIDKKCKITNNRGEYIIYNGSKYDGTMKVYDVNVLGENSNAEIEFYVDPYDSLTITGFDEEVEFSGVIDDEYYCIELDGADSATISDNHIAVTGDSYSYSSYMSSGADNTDLLSVSADASGDVSISSGDGKVNVEAEEPLTNVIISSYNDTNVTTEEIDEDVSQVEISDSQNEIKIDPVVTPSKPANTITATSSYSKTYSTKAQKIALNAKAKEGAKLTYKVNDSKIKISGGKVTIPAKYVGKFTVKVIAAGTNSYKKTTKKITITVSPSKTTLSSVKSAKGKKMTVKWKKNKSGSGYQVQYSTDKSFKKNVKTVTIKKNKTTSTTISKLAKGKIYYVRIRTAKGSLYSAWSGVKSTKIK